jgi:hypothetical protein
VIGIFGTYSSCVRRSGPLIYALAHLDRRADAEDDDARRVLFAVASEVDEKLQEATNRCKFKHCCDVCKHRWSTKEGYECTFACPKCRKPGCHIDWEDPEVPRIKEMYERLGNHLCKACEHRWTLPDGRERSPFDHASCPRLSRGNSYEHRGPALGRAGRCRLTFLYQPSSPSADSHHRCHR